MEELKWLKEQFSLNRNERRALVFLLFMFLFLNIISRIKVNNNLIYNRFNINELIDNTLPLKEQMSDSNPRAKNASNRKRNSKTSKANPTLKEKQDRSNFNKILKKKKINPNEPDFQQLSILGLSKFAINNWKKYLKSGAKLNALKQIEKIYGITSENLAALEALVVFEPKELPYSKGKSMKIGPSTNSKFKNKNHPTNNSKLEINTADLDQWQDISGIGEILSQRILKFKDRLGGFSRLDQVSEVYGITDSLFNEIKDRLEIIPFVRKIDINNVDYKTLSTHPYLDYKQAKIISRFILQNGPIEKKEDLYEIKILDEDLIQKIVPYLKF